MLRKLQMIVAIYRKVVNQYTDKLHYRTRMQQTHTHTLSHRGQQHESQQTLKRT